MELQTINQVSKDYGISTRMLRYYEQVGLIQSLRKDDYAYRVYDEKAINRLRQIIVLRKLRIPVKQIISILNNSDAAEAVEIFRQNISDIDEEITALSTVKSILTRFVDEINKKADVNLKILGDEAVFDVVGSLSFSKNQIKESKEDLSMEELSKANEELKKMSDNDVRIVYLPPMTIAAANASGENAVEKTSAIINPFIKESGLMKIKPDARGFDFEYSDGEHESWVSVPDDMEVPAPLVKRKFNGGLYAAHVLREWDFQDWRRLREWVDASDKYESDWDNPQEGDNNITRQGLEETLNLYNFSQNFLMQNLQLDLLFPIKEKEKGRFILNNGVDYASYTVDIGSIVKNFKHQYDEEIYNLPESLNLAGYNSVTVKGISANGKTAVKYYDTSGREVFVMWNNKSEDSTDWTYELSADNKNNVIYSIGIMSQDNEKYSAVINSIIFK